MARVAFTLRIRKEERDALEHLSAVEGRPVNQLLNDAIQGYLGQQGVKEQSLEASLAGLRAYRQKDPGFKKAFADFIDAEIRLDDPVEGEWIESPVESPGPVQSRIRELLSDSKLG